LKSLVRSSVMVSCSVRWKSRAFSMAIAHGSTRVSSTSRSALLNLPSSLLMISTTPMVRPREMRGAHRIERVRNCVWLSNLPAKRGSRATSLTMVGFPVLATQPAMPSPILTRKADTSLPFSPRASSKVSSWRASSTMSMDQASEGMSCWMRAMIVSMSFRGSRMELAFLTMSVRMVSRCDVFLSWCAMSSRRVLAPPPRRAARTQASTSLAGGSPLAQEPRWKSKPSPRERSRTAWSPRREREPTGEPGRALRRPRTAAAVEPRPSSTRAAANPSRLPAEGLRTRGGKNS
jgi:hypothetical protein